MTVGSLVPTTVGHRPPEAGGRRAVRQPPVQPLQEVDMAEADWGGLVQPGAAG